MHTISPCQLIAKKMMCSIVWSTQKAIVTYLLAQQLHGLDQRKRANAELGQWKRRGANSSVLWAEICCESQQSYAPARTGIPKTWKVVTDRGIAKNSSLSKMTLSNKPCTNSKALLQIFCASRMLRIRNVFPHCHSLHVADSLKSLVAIQSQNFEIKDILSSNAMCWNQSNTWFETISPAINGDFQPSFWVLFVFLPGLLFLVKPGSTQPGLGLEVKPGIRLVWVLVWHV